MTDDIMTGLGALFEEYVPKEYPHVDTNSKAYHFLQGAIQALAQIDNMTDDMRQTILMSMVRAKKDEFEGMEYVNIVCGDIFHV